MRRPISVQGGGPHSWLLAKGKLTLAALVLWAGAASAADPKPVVLCKASLTCLQTMVDDLRDYRQYLEDQLSLAKTLLSQAQARIAEQAKEIEALKAPKPPTKEK